MASEKNHELERTMSTTQMNAQRLRNWRRMTFRRRPRSTVGAE